MAGMTQIPTYNVNNNCSTGSTALYMGRQMIEYGISDCVLCVGFEKMQREFRGERRRQTLKISSWVVESKVDGSSDARGQDA